MLIKLPKCAVLDHPLHSAQQEHINHILKNVYKVEETCSCTVGTFNYDPQAIKGVCTQNRACHRYSHRYCVQNSPPDTGASIKTAPIFSAAAAMSLETAGSIVLESMSKEPFFTFLLGT